MALDDLDLEFEDEDENKKKKGDALHQDVNLEFSGNDLTKSGIAIPKPGNRPPGATLGPRTSVAPTPITQGKKVDAATARPAAAVPQPIARSSGSSALKVAPQPADQMDDYHKSQEIVELRERLRVTEFRAEVKVQVAEYKTEIIGELLGDIKLMDHQINQLLGRIHAKHPDMKQEVLLIKKILADFTAKKRK